MAEQNESRIGLFSGFLAGALVIALTAMSFVAMEPGKPLRTAEIGFPIDVQVAPSGEVRLF